MNPIENRLSAGPVRTHKLAQCYRNNHPPFPFLCAAVIRDYRAEAVDDEDAANEAAGDEAAAARSYFARLRGISEKRSLAY